jgi:flagellar biosynthesis GTPase FlhF
MTTASKDVRTFRADSVNEAIVKVKMEMGDDAEIVETREITEGGFLGFFGETRFEVDAYVPNGSPSQNGRSSSGRSDRSATGSRNGDPDREKLRERIESLSRQMQDSNGTSNGTDTGARTAPAKSPSAEDEAGHEWNVDDPAMPEFSARERAKQLIEDQSDELGDLDSNGSGTYDRTGVGSNNGSPESADPAPSENPSSNPSSPIDSSRNKQEIEQLMEQTDLIAEKVDNLMDSVENETATKEQSASPDFPGELDDLYHQLVGMDVEKKFARDEKPSTSNSRRKSSRNSKVRPPYNHRRTAHSSCRSSDPRAWGKPRRLPNSRPIIPLRRAVPWGLSRLMVTGWRRLNS